MNEQCTEMLIKRKQVPGLKEMKILSVLAIIVLFVVAIVFKLLVAFIGAIGMFLIYHFILLRLEVEFEYLYFSGELDIDKIYSKSKRKKVISINANDIRLIEPVESEEIQTIGDIKTINCSANNPNNLPYAIICNQRGSMKKIIVQMNDELLKCLRPPGNVVRRLSNESI